MKVTVLVSVQIQLDKELDAPE